MTTPGPQVRALPTAQAVAEEAVRVVRDVAGRAVAARGRFSLALSGGHTPRGLYALLAQAGAEGLPYDRTEIFWSDERALPPDHRESNYRLAWGTWLSRVPVSAEHIHRVRGEIDPQGAAAEYEREVLRVLGDPPRFDLVLLGMGSDGHTASLFPGDPALESNRLVVAVRAPIAPYPRVTFTFRVIEAARHILVLATGGDKAEAIKGALGNPLAPGFPAARLRRPHVLWLLDEAAAAVLR